MKKTVLIYGLLGGAISVIGYLITMITGAPHDGFAMLIGFASMILAFSLIFVAASGYRKTHGEAATFGRLFLAGLYITLIASTIYVLVWLYYLYNVYPDFATDYTTGQLEALKASGASATEIAAETAKMKELVLNYKKPWFVILLTYSEIVPVGLIFSLISAAAFRYRQKRNLK